MAIIYIIKNTVNDKCYIGQCQDVVSRYEAHLRATDNIPLHIAIQTLGADKFYYEVLDEVADDIRLDVETYYIDKFNTLIPNGYNFYRHSSDGFYKKNHSSETSAKISQSLKLWWSNASEDELSRRNKKISESNKGKIFTSEHKQKLSDIAKLRTGSKNPFYGKKHSPESIRKMQLTKSRKYFRLDVNNVVIQEYDTIQDVSDWVISQQITNAKQSSIQYRIYCVVEGRQQTAYGYKWSCKECNDYPIGGESPQ